MSKTIITHDGSFHADDVFAVATLELVFKDEEIKIIRTRDSEIIKSGDIVLDVGRVYDGERFFDHHQEGGAGKRENEIPYASFGLIWKKFGPMIASSEVCSYVDSLLVQSVDAMDNGVDLAHDQKIKIFSVSDAIRFFNKTQKESISDDEAFRHALDFAKKIIERLLLGAKDYEESLNLYRSVYDASINKELIISDTHIRKDVLSKISGVLFVVMPGDNSTWVVRAVRKDEFSFESKKLLPASWAGKDTLKLREITGVSDALFCHNGRFIANASSKEGAVALAKIALQS